MAFDLLGRNPTTETPGDLDLEGQLVEVFGLSGRLPLSHKLVRGHAFGRLEIGEASPEDRAAYPEGVDANGLCGWCRSRDEAADGYLVETFDGLVLSVPGEHLRRFDPPEPEDGGFDVAWPAADAEYDVFASAVVEAVLRKGHCVVQMLGMGRAFQAEALEVAQSREDFRVLERELEASYLGDGESGGKVAQLGAAPAGCLELCDEVFTVIGQLLEPVALEALGFGCHGRSSSLLRVPRGDAPRDCITDTDVNEGVVEGLLHFLRRRKLCMLCVVSDDGGEISFTPKEGLGWTRSRVPVAGNRLFLFRHDLMAYTYTPAGEGLVVQSWLYSPPLSLVYDNVEGGDAEERKEVLGALGAPQPTLPCPHVRAIAVRLSGNANSAEEEYGMICQGMDGLTAWPRSRWDQDIYYEPDEQVALMSGKSYNQHGGFLEDHHFLKFDNDLFGYTGKGEAEATSIETRLMLEVGYECLYRNGRRRPDLRGAEIGMVTAVYENNWLEIGARNEYLLKGFTSMQTAACVAQFVGTKGPILRVDTACSSSLVATATADHDLRMRGDGASNLVQAVMGQNNPFGWGALCQMGMLSKKGRCFTFDNSSDGFAKGEGCSAVWLEFEGSREGRMASLAGSAINQDGRSASMTAPNGPSQRENIRSCMDVAGITPAELAVSECHGTGTALGDPIEIGALRAAMDGSRSGNNPLMVTTVKGNLAHMEANAGLSGIIKVASMLRHQAVPMCVHVKSLNPHLDIEGFPWYIVTEFVDPCRTDMFIGVQGFGLGGTNARTDFWGRTSEGYRNPYRNPPKQERADFSNVPCPRCLGPMCWLCGVAVPKYSRERKRHRCSLVREGPGVYEGAYDFCSSCYTGEHACGEAEEEIPSLYDLQSRGIKIFAMGTWSAYTTYHELEETAPGVFTFALELGETQAEQFHFVLSRDPSMAYYPAAKNAGASLRVLGPDDDVQDRHWLIDGKETGAPSGTIFAVTLTWDDDTGAKRVSWRAVSDDDDDDFPDRIRASDYSHSYYVLGSWLGFKREPMRLVSREEGIYEARFRMGVAHREQFRILRDNDDLQSLHPPFRLCEESGVPAKGPDELGEDKNWVVTGRAGEEVRVELRVQDGSFSVTAACPSQPRLQWKSAGERHGYFVGGSFNDWTPSRMQADPSARGVYHYHVAWDGFEAQEFQIVVDNDLTQVMYPASAGADSGTGLLLGPGEGGAGKHWQIAGWPGVIYEIELNLNQEDRRKMVQWRQVPADDDYALEG
mmetsp:Transcript_35498/g.110182  ORF Transcript_35498/g.110182 Transcript_35498/m.110182 type:complete len:1250 (+) Transcript_35498:121-3870(+)